jgi:hypothetical protein
MLAFIKAIAPDWIEFVSGWDPDLGDGSAEWLIVAGLYLVTVVLILGACLSQRPGYIQLMGDGASASIVPPAHEKEQSSRDYDFSASAIQGYQSEGYAVAKTALGRA